MLRGSSIKQGIGIREQIGIAMLVTFLSTGLSTAGKNRKILPRPREVAACEACAARTLCENRMRIRTHARRTYARRHRDE